MKLLILGAGGHGQAVAEAAELSGKYDEICFLDDSWPNRERAGDWKVAGNVSSLSGFGKGEWMVFPAVGNNKLRQAWVELIVQAGFDLANIVHPAAFVSPRAHLAEGIAVMAGAVVGPNAKVGLGCILNANCTVDHDAVLQDYAHLGVGVDIAGGVKVGKSVFLQAGSCASYFVEVPDCLVSAPGTAFSKQN